MKRTVFAVIASVVLASTLSFAQSQAPAPSQNPQEPRTPSATQPAPSQDKATEVRISGCLIQGSSPTVFIVDNARLATDPKTAEGKKYIVVMSDAAGLRNQLNRQVTITGTTDATTAVTVTTPPAGTPDAGKSVTVQVRESDLPRFSAKTIVRVADVCTTTE